MDKKGKSKKTEQREIQMPQIQPRITPQMIKQQKNIMHKKDKPMIRIKQSIYSDNI